MRVNLTRNQRIKIIERYFLNVSGIAVSFDNERACLSHIITYVSAHEDRAEEILQELYYLLEYSFSTQNPNYIYSFEISERAEIVDRNLRRSLRRTIQHGEFEFKKTNYSYDPIDEIVKIEFDYEEFAVNEVTGESFRKSAGMIKLTMDFIHRKFITSKAPNVKAHSHIFEYFKRELGAGTGMKPFYILKRKRTLNKFNDTEFSATTILIINLLFDTIPTMGYDVTLEAISFSNLDSQNIHGVRLKGFNLLTATEVLQRVHTGDDIHHLKVTLEQIHTDQPEHIYFNTSFIIDLQGKLCFIFNEGIELNPETRNICYKLQENLISLISTPGTVEKGAYIINDKLPIPPSHTHTIATIYEDLGKIFSKKEDKLALDEYFSKNYPSVMAFQKIQV